MTRRSDQEIAAELQMKLGAVLERQARKSDPSIGERRLLAQKLRAVVNNLQMDEGSVLAEALLDAATELDISADLLVHRFAESNSAKP
jgi:hypothetical protein